jgi:hypothetical protein
MTHIECVSDDSWEEVARSCPWAMFSHTPGWAGIIARTWPEYEPAGLAFRLSDGTRAVLPSVRRIKKRLLVKRTEYKSMEPGIYGGFIAERQLTGDDVGAMAGELLARKNTSGRIVGSPFVRLELSNRFRVKSMYTHVVDLRDGYATIQTRFNRGQKSNLRQALKKQVQVRIADSRRDVDRYYLAYMQSHARWGERAAGVYPQELFYTLFEHGRPHVRFWLAEVNGMLAAAGITLAWNHAVLYWHGASVQEYFKWYPANLLHSRIMEWACAERYHYYDMGASMGLGGVEQFKESFGARKTPFSSYRWK